MAHCFCDFCEKRAQCLEKIGMDFTYNLGIRSAQYNSPIDHFALQLWCMRPEEKYYKCINFKSQDVEGKDKKDNFHLTNNSISGRVSDKYLNDVGFLWG